MKNIKIIIAVFSILLMAFSIAACSNQQNAQQQPTQQPAEPMQLPNENTADANSNVEPEETDNNGNSDIQESIPPKGDSGQLKEIEVRAFKFGFSPDPIIVEKGDKVRLIVKSEDVEHGIAIPDFGINAEIEPGKTTIVEFTADKQGEFTIFCSVFCGSGHQAMKGSLIVK